jgi:hypothetical protein
MSLHFTDHNLLDRPLDIVDSESAGRSLQRNVLGQRAFKSVSYAIDKRQSLVLL